MAARFFARSLTCSLLTAGLAAAQINVDDFPSDRTIKRDVVVLGGGASGAHAAVRLREDFGKSIVVVEKQGRLGGHVATYEDDEGNTFEFGVQSYLEYGEARAFFERFDIPVAGPARVPLTSQYADFLTGAPVDDYIPPETVARTEGLNRFLEAAAPYEDMILPGYWDFPQPEDIPEDLLMPFGEFAKKYGFEDAMPQMFQVPGPGVPDWAGAPTLHCMQVFGVPMGKALTGALPTFAPESRNNSELYGKIQELLGEDVLYSSTVVEAERGDNGVKLIVRAEDDEDVLVLADRLLIAFEPTLDAMKPFALDEQEQAVFEKWDYSNVFAGIVTHPSLPINVSIVNTVPDAAPDNYLAFPEAPILARFDYMGAESNLFRNLIVGEKDLDEEGARQLVRDSLATMLEAGTLPEGDIEDLEFVAFVDHGAMHLRASEEEIRGGFIQEQYALQGHRSTWYTGAAWSVQFTTILWEYNEVVLPKLLASMEKPSCKRRKH